MTQLRARAGGHLSDLDLDRRSAGTEDPIRRAEVDAHLGVCPHCVERWQEVQHQQAAFQGRALPAFLTASADIDNVRSIAADAVRGARGPRWLGPAIGALAIAAIALLVVVGPAEYGRGTIGEGDATRMKGGVSGLSMQVVAAGEARSLALVGEVLHPGDVVTWRVNLRAPRYVAVLGRDAVDVVSVYFPLRAPDSALADAPLLQAGERVVLGTEVELDATLGTEKIWALFCSEPVTIADLKATIAEHGEAARFPASCEVQRASFVKTARP